MFRNDNRKGVRLGVSHTPCAVGVVGNYFTSSNIMIVDIQSIITTCSKYEHDMIELHQTQSSRINQLEMYMLYLPSGQYQRV